MAAKPFFNPPPGLTERELRVWLTEAFDEQSLTTEPLDPDKYRRGVEYIYRKLGVPVPAIVECDGPDAGWQHICRFFKKDWSFVMPSNDGCFNVGRLVDTEVEWLRKGIIPDSEYLDYRACLHLHYLWPLDEICVLVQRPLYFRYNSEKLPHCENGPCTEYRDGTKLWAINGIDMNETIVMRPHEQTIKQIHADTNNDRRAIRIERFGWTRYLQEVGAVEVDERSNDVTGALEVLYQYSEGKRLVVTCMTGRIFALGVPNEVGTCEEAQRYLEGDAKLNVIGRT